MKKLLLGLVLIISIPSFAAESTISECEQRPTYQERDACFDALIDKIGLAISGKLNEPISNECEQRPTYEERDACFNALIDKIELAISGE